ncbi:apolipoprotein D [Halyomorpha halys]|uniref:apolipoprotein D n=1 Tax=Halyomorpha halys TaxID=286706 RepID=UPI0006D4CF5B|nr:apolipoprotein D-like [Halyomorpha halys]
MKLQISLLVLVAVVAALTSAWNPPPVVVGLCKQSSILGDLEPEKYFNRKWYVWKSHGGFLFDRTGNCAGQDSKIEGNEVELLNFQYEPLLGKYVTAKGEADADYIQRKGLAFPVNYNLGGFNFTIAFNILGTDYDNWAAVYLCRQLIGMKIEMSWLLVRDKETTLTSEQQEAISKTISNVGFTLGDYELKNNRNCGSAEPHL